MAIYYRWIIRMNQEEYLIDFVNERLETDYGKDMIEEPESDDESEKHGCRN